MSFEDFDYHGRPFSPAALVEVINACVAKVPGCMVGRSGNGTGNLCVYDSEEDYVGVIELHDPPELNLFGDDDETVGNQP